MASRTIKVLLVDDDEDDYVMTRELLAEVEGEQFELEWVATYAEGLEVGGRREHDVYLLDYRLGEGNGLELLRELIERGCRAPVILLTGQGDREADEEAMKAGAGDYLVKGQIGASLLGRSIRYALERARTVQALRESEVRYQKLVELSPDAILVHVEGNLVFVNSASVKLLGATSAEQLLGASVLSFVHEDDQECVRERMRQNIHEGKETPFMEQRFVRLDGSEVFVEAAAVPFVYQDQPAAQVVVRDITQRKQVEEKLIYEAHHDSLTGLPNRALLREHLTLAVGRAKRNKQYLFAVLFLDLDRFKNVNDGLGHTLGDQLLIDIARRLSQKLRRVDIMARLGGDEFAILLDGIEDSSGAIRVAERLQAELKQPFNVGGHEVFATASIGIALSSTNYEYPEDILRDADTAMYRAKSLGKARHEIFDTNMHSRARALLQLETDLRRAVEREEFCVYYQPIVSLKSGEVSGFEALVRWQHPDRGLILPDQFIPVAEETGLINVIGLMVLRDACRQMRRWQQLYAESCPRMLNVNLSGRQLAQPDLVAQVTSVLQETQFEPGQLQLEVTESVLLENTEIITATLEQLRAEGIRLSMDDFGTGYSSLSYLHRLPLHTLKIDRSFISHEGQCANNEIVPTIIFLAHKMSLCVVAEGVETEAQLTYLRTLECDYGQGYLFSRPVSAEAVEEILRAAPPSMYPASFTNQLPVCVLSPAEP